MARKLSLAQKRKVVSGQSETELSALVKSGLGLDVSPEKLKKFVRDNFFILSILGHEIHAQELAETGEIELNR